jgi:flagellar motor switch protein FliM
MSADAEVLNQDEIDALLKGVDNGAVPLDTPDAQPGEARDYDLATQVRIVRGRMPTLEMINERFARLLRIGIYNLIRRSPEISVAPVALIKFSEYVQTLQQPASLNLVKVNPLRGTALFVLDATLVSALVDCYFGGSGRHAKIEGREFTRTENRVIQLVLGQACNDIREAWSPVAKIDIEAINAESNPQFANIVSPSEIVAVTSLRIELDGRGGELHVTMPYAMIEPLREVLDAGMQSDRPERDERWSSTLREELEEAEVEVVPVLGRSTLSVGRLLNLKPGDVIPCDFDGHVTLLAEGVPILRGSYGASRGQQAVKVEQHLARSRQARHNKTMMVRK